jgi:serine/threonine protein kinase
MKKIDEIEPLLDGGLYQKTNFCPSKRIEKRIGLNNNDEFCFKEFSNNAYSYPIDESQFEIRRQVNILKELKRSDNIIRFFGVSLVDSKYYLVTEWMEYGNLYEYYTKFRSNINWDIRIKIALDACRGVAYLHGHKISLI